MPEITIEVVYALPQVQTTVVLRVPQGTTVRQALERSGLAERYPEINVSGVVAGIFGRQVDGDVVLGDHDRVEIYRPLRIDPKQSRRNRAALRRK